MNKSELFKILKNCRNELCYRCGNYKEAHIGACDGCRYNDANMEKIEKEANNE